MPETNSDTNLTTSSLSSPFNTSPPRYGDIYTNGHPNGHVNGNGHPNGNGNGNRTPPSAPRYTSHSSPSTPRRSINGTKILGVIDENGGMSPDIPVRSSKRTLPNGGAYTYNPRTFLTSLFPTSVSKPQNELDNVTGPRGEKFSDVRENRRSFGGSDESGERKRNILRRGGWRAMVCLGAVLVIIAALVAIGVVVGLKRMHEGRNSNDSDSSLPANDSTALTSFPVGSYIIPAYLLSQTATCTPNPSTWRCFPYTLYSTNQAESFSTLSWSISGTNTTTGPQYTISAPDNPFLLPFTNEILTLLNPNTPDEHYKFTTTLPKIVFPDAVITDDGATARCYYNSSMIIGMLYTRRPSTLGDNSTTTQDGAWPFAVQYLQTSDQPPTCFRVMNGEDEEEVVLTGNVTEGRCMCDYASYEDGAG